MTVREFHRNASKVLAAAGRGERVTVTEERAADVFMYI